MLEGNEGNCYHFCFVHHQGEMLGDFEKSDLHFV